MKADVPLGALTGLEGNHAGVHRAPFLAEGIGEVVLVFDGDEFLGRRGVGLNGLDLRRQAFDIDSVVSGGVEDADGGGAALPVEVAPVVVVEVVGEGLAVGGLEIILSSSDGGELAGGEDVVVVVDRG